MRSSALTYALATTAAQSEDALSAVSRARLELVLDHPFFGSLACRLRPVVDLSMNDQNHRGVLWTDGVRLGVNPEAFLALNPQERIGLIAHEVMHCTNGHPWRQGHRDDKNWARACDLAINDILADSGFELPEGCAVPNQSSQKNQSAESIYSELQRQPQDEDSDGEGDGEGNGSGKSAGMPGSGQGDQSQEPGSQPEDGDGDGQGNQPRFTDPGAMRKPQCQQDGNTGETERLENDWKIATIQAAIAAKMRGMLPGSLAQLVEDVKKPKIDWRAELRRFMQAHAKNDYSWTRPSSRYMARGLYMPALHSEQIGPMVIAIDTSGSIGDEELKQFMGECQSIVEEIKPEFTLVLEVDAAVNGVNRYESGEAFTLPAIHGRGGTSFVPAFNYVHDDGIEPACFVYLTDLYGSYPEEPPSYPVLWICTTDMQANWGQTIKIDIHEGD
jgi:predicted metal-dependent peptidase